MFASSDIFSEKFINMDDNAMCNQTKAIQEGLESNNVQSGKHVLKI